MDLPTMTDDDLDALRVAVLIEIERRRTIASAPAQAAELADRYASAIGLPAGLAQTVAIRALLADVSDTTAFRAWSPVDWAPAARASSPY